MSDEGVIQLPEDEVDPAVVQALNGVPNFMDLPDEYRETVEKKTLTAERMFWLRTSLIEQTPVTQALLRRAMYAEQRCYESEFRLGEVSLIASGMKDEIDRLQGELTKLAKATG